MDRTRKIFVGLLALFGMIVLGAGVIATTRSQQGSAPQPQAQSANAAQPSATAAPAIAPTGTPAPVAAPTVQLQPTPEATAVPLPTPAVTLQAKLQPVFGSRYRAGDGLPTVVCGAYAFSADYVLQQIQVAGLDVKNGFHLGIVPFYLNENYVVTAKERSAALENGSLDCLLTTFDLAALEDPGILTAFINESAGGDQLWARDMSSLNDLKGKRIAFEADGPSAFFVYDLLSTVQLKPSDVTLLPQPNQAAAIEAFNKGDADAVSGWEPVIFDAKKGGGKPLATSREFRSILGGIVMSRASMLSKRTALQAFHDAWFQALDVQEKDFATAAQQIADWGNNDYLGVQKASAEQDLRLLLGGVAQASLADNARAFADVSAIGRRFQQARGLWALNGHTVPTGDVANAIDASFVQSSARERRIDPNYVSSFVNNSFSIGRSSLPAQANSATPGVTEVPPPAPQTLATLPCRRFEFQPNSTQLSASSIEQLDSCAVGVLQQNISLQVRLTGSSAWPGPNGTYTQAAIEQTAKARAQAVADYLRSKGISRERLYINFVLPKPENRETLDAQRMAEDRFVEIELLAPGL